MAETRLTTARAHLLDAGTTINKRYKIGTRVKDLETAVIPSVSDATASRVCTSADYGSIVMLSHADTVAITLPANGATAGSWIDFMLVGDNSLAVTISPATAATLIQANDSTAASVTYNAGSRIGAYCRAISDGSYWHVLNLGGTTMTVNT